MEALLEYFDLLLFAVLLLAGFGFGTIAEKRHYASIRKREKELRNIIVVPEKRLPRQDCDTAFVCGSAFTAWLMRVFLACFTAMTRKAEQFGKTK